MVQFQPINERLAFVDIKRGKFSLRLVTPYFPHSGYADRDIQRMYDTLAPIHTEATTKHMHFLIASDFNAQVGPATDYDTHHTIGQYGLNPQDARSQWLKIGRQSND